MAKPNDNKRRIAHHYYVEKGYTTTAIAEMLEMSRKTISTWLNKGNWNTEKEARELSAKNRATNRDQVLRDLATDRINLRRQIKEEEDGKEPDGELIKQLRKSIAQTDDAISKWNKAKTTAEKEDRIRLDIYLEVMDGIFSALRLYDFSLYQNTIDFQEKHINDISNLF